MKVCRVDVRRDFDGTHPALAPGLEPGEEGETAPGAVGHQVHQVRVAGVRALDGAGGLADGHGARLAVEAHRQRGDSQRTLGEDGLRPVDGAREFLRGLAFRVELGVRVDRLRGDEVRHPHVDAGEAVTPLRAVALGRETHAEDAAQVPPVAGQFGESRRIAFLHLVEGSLFAVQRPRADDAAAQRAVNNVTPFSGHLGIFGKNVFTHGVMI